MFSEELKFSGVWVVLRSATNREHKHPNSELPQPEGKGMRPVGRPNEPPDKGEEHGTKASVYLLNSSSNTLNRHRRVHLSGYSSSTKSRHSSLAVSNRYVCHQVTLHHRCGLAQLWTETHHLYVTFVPQICDLASGLTDRHYLIQHQACWQIFKNTFKPKAQFYMKSVFCRVAATTGNYRSCAVGFTVILKHGWSGVGCQK